MTSKNSDQLSPWSDAILAAALFAIDPIAMSGIVVKSRSGPVRDVWFATLQSFIGPGTALRRVPGSTEVGRLIGGLDLAATLRAGRPVADRGLLAEADGGIVVLPSVERAERQTIAHVAAALDRGGVAIERDGFRMVVPARFGVVAFDEGIAEGEETDSTLTDRLAFCVRLQPMSIRDANVAPEFAAAVALARGKIPLVAIGDDQIEGLCAVSLAIGIGSMRPALHAVTVARAAAALNGRKVVTDEDVETAVRLVMAPKARQLPQAQSEDQAPQSNAEQNNAEQDQGQQYEPPPPDSASGEMPDIDQMSKEEQLIAAAAAAIPADLLSRLMAAHSPVSRSAKAGKAGKTHRSKSRGRRIGSERGELNTASRIDLLATLRAAAPWQVLRRRERRGEAGRVGRLDIRREDIRVMRFKVPAETATIFVVDASGSSALHRLGEAKGAIELMLTDCYARRDSVALISFRGKSADTLLEPTRSLARAKRNLAALPGGGGTPLASAIDVASALADNIRRRGQSPIIVFLTDGRANVARDGTGGRTKAAQEALAAARSFLAAGHDALLIDTSPHPKPEAADIAGAMGARYMPLPHGDAAAISAAVRGRSPA
jgi:magnesium chelatase subunit D